MAAGQAPHLGRLDHDQGLGLVLLLVGAGGGLRGGGAERLELRHVQGLGGDGGGGRRGRHRGRRHAAAAAAADALQAAPHPHAEAAHLRGVHVRGVAMRMRSEFKGIAETVLSGRTSVDNDAYAMYSRWLRPKCRQLRNQWRCPHAT